MVKIFKKQKPIIYIFCEGKTEKKYFTQLSRVLNNNVKVVSVDLEGGTKIMDHPKKIITKIDGTIKHSKKIGLPKNVFIVFDLDIFIDGTKLQNAQNILKDYNLIYNNECFEYWILSHFKKYDLGKGKKKYLDEIRKFLPDLPLGKDYKMVGNEDFNWLENVEQVKFAINNVKEINKLSTGNLKDRDPYSDVYKIIEFLRS